MSKPKNFDDWPPEKQEEWLAKTREIRRRSEKKRRKENPQYFATKWRAFYSKNSEILKQKASVRRARNPDQARSIGKKSYKKRYSDDPSPFLKKNKESRRKRYEKNPESEKKKSRTKMRQYRTEDKALALQSFIKSLSNHPTKNNTMTAEMTLPQESQSQLIDQLIHHLRKGSEQFIAAGRILVRMVEANPRVYDEITAQHPSLSPRLLQRLENIGRGTLHPELLIVAVPGLDRLGKLPLDMQERYLHETVPLVVETEGGTDILQVKLGEVTRAQTAQLFDGNRLRTVSEQKIWLVDQRAATARKVNRTPAPYRISKGKAIIGGMPFTAAELEAIAQELRKRK